MDSKDAYAQKLRSRLQAREAKIDSPKTPEPAPGVADLRGGGLRRTAGRHRAGLAGAGPGAPVMSRMHFLGLALLASMGLAAGCGGGGVDFGDPNEERINRSNALDVARLVVGRSMDTLALVDLVGEGLVEPVLDPLLAGTLDGRVADFDCENGDEDGQVSVTLNDQDEDGLVSQDDTASLSFSNCRDLFLERSLSGTTVTDAAFVSVFESASRVQVPQPPWTIGVNVDFTTGLTLTGPDESDTAQLDGLLSTAQSASSDGLIRTKRANAIRFNFDDAIGQDSLRDVQLSLREDRSLGVPATFQITLAGTDPSGTGRISSTRLGGTFSFQTNSPLGGTVGDVPTVGSVTVFGGDGTSVQILAAQSGLDEVRLLVDEDGDGDVDSNDPEPLGTSWRQLDFF